MKEKITAFLKTMAFITSAAAAAALVLTIWQCASQKSAPAAENKRTEGAFISYGDHVMLL